jgi:hypothetical protein
MGKQRKNAGEAAGQLQLLFEEPAEETSPAGDAVSVEGPAVEQSPRRTRAKQPQKETKTLPKLLPRRL